MKRYAGLHIYLLWVSRILGILLEVLFQFGEGK